jgi:hypothetical protein
MWNYLERNMADNYLSPSVHVLKELELTVKL